MPSNNTVQSEVEYSRSDDGAHDAHDAVEADGDAVAGAAVRRGQDFGGVGVEGAVIDVLSVRTKG